GIDDVSGSGFTVRNGGFESDEDWTLSNNTARIIPSIDLFADHDPSNILRAAAAAVAGQPFSLLPPRGYEPPTIGFSSDRDSMYGDGRLSLSVPENTSTQAGQCATASQVVSVDPASPRYEISFWEYLRHFTAGLHGGSHTVSVTVDGQPIWS